MTRIPTPRPILASLAVMAIGLTPISAPAGTGPIADVLCAPDAQMLHRLKTRYGAQRTWTGLRSPDEVMELWEDRQGEWTLTIAHAGGHRCIVAMGTGLLPYAPQPHG